MAFPVVAVAKAAAAVLANEKTRRAAGWVLAAVLAPLILIVALVCGLISGAAQHNAAAADLIYYGGALPQSMPAGYRDHVGAMRSAFTALEEKIAAVSVMTENGNGLDAHWVKAVFFSLFFGSDTPSTVGISAFVDCFVRYEQRTRSVMAGDGAGAHEVEEVYTVAVPVAGPETVYTGIAALLGREITEVERENAVRVCGYTRSAGDTFSGAYERGGGGNLALDISLFTNPATKNNLDLTAYALHAWESGWGYVWGTYGEVLSASLLAYKLEQYPDGVGNYADFIRANWLESRTSDCAGLIKGYGWLNPNTLTLDYGSNGMPDISADAMYQNAAVKGNISSMPDTPGIAVWHEGHIGVYVGGGEVVESLGTRYGVVKTRLAERNWTDWLEVPSLSYEASEGK
jgi:hypothetical protein